MSPLNSCGTKLLHFGQNPHCDYLQCRTINPRKNEYLRLNFPELEYFVTMAKQAALEMPFRISNSLFATKKLFNRTEEMFLLERTCAKCLMVVPNKIYIGIRNLEYLRELFSLIKLTLTKKQHQM